MKAVIFDMDGVIVDSEHLHVLAEKEVLARHKINITEDDLYPLKGKTSSDIFFSILSKHNVKHVTPEQLAEEKTALYIKSAPQEIQLFEGFMDLLTHLHQKYKIALTTSSNKQLQKLVFDKFNLYHLFEVVVTGDLVKNGKPHPEPYLLTIQKLGINPAEAIVIEDSDTGVTSAKNAGIKTIAVTHTFPKERLQHADFVVESLHKVKEVIEIIDKN